MESIMGRNKILEGQEMITKVDLHKSICADMSSIYAKKNADYGDSFAKMREEYGDVYLLSHLAEKLARLKTLMLKGNPQVVGESIEDTLHDLANYCILELIERRFKNVNASSGNS
jgi:hypothetical protein